MPGPCGHDRIRRMTSVESLGDSSLVRRIAAAPHLQATDEARARVANWRVEIAGVSAGKTLTRLAAAHPRLDALITGLADRAPSRPSCVRGGRLALSLGSRTRFAGAIRRASRSRARTPLRGHAR